MFITCLRRLFWALLSLLLTSFIVFTLSYYFWIPLDRKSLQRVDSNLGESNSLYVFEGFFEWFKDVFNEISGKSETKTPNFLFAFFKKLRFSLLLSLPIFLIAFLLSFSMSWLAAIKRDSFAKIFLAFSRFFASIPTLLNVFVLLLFLLLGGRKFPSHSLNLDSPWLFYLSYLGVVVVLFLPLFSKLSLQNWETFNALLKEDYVFNAQARGIKLSLIFRKYIFKNMMLRISESLFWEFSKLLQLIFVIEQIFGFEGASNIVVYWEQNGNTGLLLLLFLFFGLLYHLGLFLQDIYIWFFNPTFFERRHWRIVTLFNWVKVKTLGTKAKRQE